MPHYIAFPFMLSVALLAGCSSKLETAAAKAEEAAILFEAGNIEGARAAALASVEARDDQAAVWILLGRIALTKGAIGDAFEAYSRAVELDAGNVEALQTLSEIALQSGRQNEALRTADMLIALRPELARPKLIKGFIALQRNDPVEAAKLADEIVALDPSEDAGLVLKARILAREGKLAEADKVLSERIDPGELILATLVEVRRKAGNGEGLENALSILVGKAPTTERVFDLAAVRYKLGRIDAARAAIFERLEAQPRDTALYDRAANYFLEVDQDVFDRTRLAPIVKDGQPPLRELSAGVLLERGRALDAKDILEPMIPSAMSPDGWSLYATALHALGKVSDAQGIISRILAADEDNAIALLLRARSSLASRRFNEALRDAQQVVADNPKSLQGRLLVIEIYLQRGDIPRARRLFEQAAIEMPQNIRLTKAFIAFLLKTGDRARALNVADTFAQVNPARLNGWDMLSAICPDTACRDKAASGKRAALSAFVPDDQIQLGGSGLFGRL